MVVQVAGLRRSAVMVKKALSDLFHFIGDSDIPKTTNGLNAYFGHLKLILGVHRGLSNSTERRLSTGTCT